MTICKVKPQKLKQWIDKNVTDNLLREILDEWTWGKDPPDVVIEDNEILGFCASRKEGKRFKCCYLFVHPEGRGKGYGKALIERSFQRAKELGLNYLYVSEERFDGWKIFKNHGFSFTLKESEGLKDYYFEVETAHRQYLF